MMIIIIWLLWLLLLLCDIMWKRSAGQPLPRQAPRLHAERRPREPSRRPVPEKACRSVRSMPIFVISVIIIIIIMIIIMIVVIVIQNLKRRAKQTRTAQENE